MSSNFISGWGKLWDRKTVTSLGGWVTQTYQLTLDRGGRRRQVRKKPRKRVRNNLLTVFFIIRTNSTRHRGLLKTLIHEIFYRLVQKNQPVQARTDGIQRQHDFFLSKFETQKNICWKNPVWTCSIQTIVVKKPKFRLCQMPNSRKAIPTTTSI